jgi:hypothetical protein
MTVAVAVPFISYAATGVGPYAIPFPFQDAAHIFVQAVSVDGVVTSPAFTISGTNVTLGAAIATGKIVIYRQSPDDQPVRYPDLQAFPAQAVERSFDRLALRQQELARDLAGTVRAAIGKTLLPLPANLANSILAFDANEVPIAIKGLTPPTVPVSNFGASLVLSPDAKAARDLLDFVVVTKSDPTPLATAQAAFLANKPILNQSNTPLSIVINPAQAVPGNGPVANVGRYELVQRAYNFVDACAGKNPKILVADGMHMLSGFANLNGNRVSIAAQNGPTILTMSGITWVGVAGSIYEATIGVTTAIPPVVTVGWPVGLQNVVGTNSAKALNGANFVTQIAGDRLSFKVQVRCVKPPSLAACVVSTGASNGVAQSRVIIPSAVLNFVDGWDGNADEGGVNQFKGSFIRYDQIGIAYSGPAGVDRDLIFARDLGTATHFGDYTVVVGAEARVWRGFAAAQIYGQNACFGGGTTADIGIYLQDSTHALLSRCSIGGFTAANILAVNSKANITDCFFGAAERALYSVNSEIIAEVSNIFGCTYAAFVTMGGVIDFGDGVTATTLEGNLIGLDGLSGEIRGDPVFTNNTAIASTGFAKQAKIGQLSWLANRTQPLSNGGNRVSLANNAVAKFPLAGVAGIVDLFSLDGLATQWGGLATNIALRSAEARGVGTGVNFVAGNVTDLTGTGGVAGKVNITVFDRAGVPELQINNNATGGGFVAGFAFSGNLRRV